MRAPACHALHALSHARPPYPPYWTPTLAGKRDSATLYFTYAPYALALLVSLAVMYVLLGPVLLPPAAAASKAVVGDDDEPSLLAGSKKKKAKAN